MIPEAAIENCDSCAQASGVIDTKCRGCVARYVSRLVPPASLKWYIAARACHGEAVVDAFIADVSIWRAKARRAER